ncbi:auxin efflux carrier component 5-like isoform X2 [Salvia miltiorrhiza]|uniref:auxin efflux carrier component 5-like isoform X2 n=1 Tax=Salvia miltiorrhiza TaxID=226208 RepID=UPI0025ACE9F5|nr:auxin efflux carrier component 5-like isoform X2 [Salvia miltiorrhiza]
MIGWEDVWKVVEAMAPLYAALMLGYGSVKWWRILRVEQCEAINLLAYYFTYPMFVFEFTAHADPFTMNYTFMAADAISKVIIVAVLACWAKWCSKGNYCWSITSFSLTTLTNSLVVGVPFLKAMYGQMGVDLVVQSSVFQALVWLTILLFILELKHTRDIDLHRPSPTQIDHDLENLPTTDALQKEIINRNTPPPLSLRKLIKEVSIKISKNPNSYACMLGVTWAFISNRWHFSMPSIVEGSILIMSRAGTGTAMFSMGLFMASQDKVLACGANLTIFGMALKFIAGPLAMALASFAVGLHGQVLRVAIIQAALPQSITSFIFAKEYGLHANVLSTAVIFGMIVSLPVLIGYYAALEFVH